MKPDTILLHGQLLMIISSQQIMLQTYSTLVKSETLTLTLDNIPNSNYRAEYK